MKDLLTHLFGNVFGKILWRISGARVPRVELVRFKPIDFFPCPADLGKLKQICIGSKTRTIGDALMLTTLPALMKAKYPTLEIFTYPRAFNPVVFANNPHIAGVNYLPGTLYGDDCNFDSGQLIQLKENYFGLPVTTPPRPQLFLSDKEIILAREMIGESPKPFIVIHPWGKTHDSVLNEFAWEQILSSYVGRFRFFQVGIEGQKKIKECEGHFLFTSEFTEARKLFAVMSRAQGFLGVDSGPMHAARAFNITSWIASDYGKKPETLFEDRKAKPYYLSHGTHAFLYEENTHVDVTLDSLDAVIASAIHFLSQFKK